MASCREEALENSAGPDVIHCTAGQGRNCAGPPRKAPPQHPEIETDVRGLSNSDLKVLALYIH